MIAIDLAIDHLLVESSVVYYHGSQLVFPVGTILQPQQEGYVYEEPKVEAIVERFRPANKISRFESVFMVDNPSLVDFAGGYDDNIYVVDPIGQVDRSDLAWYTDISVYLDVSIEEQKQWSLNYWDGVPYKKPANSLWEYRARTAKIIKEIGWS